MKSNEIDISVNDANQLVVTEVSKGRLFSRRSQNSRRTDSISYETKTESRQDESELKRVVLNGKWSFTEEMDLRVRILGNKSDIFGKYIIFYGNVEKIDGTKICFRIRECDTLLNLRTRTIELSGRWCADNKNRLNFKVYKSDGSSDKLCFQGGWDINKHNEIIYRYTKIGLKTKKKFERELILRGYWSFSRNKISYTVEKTDDTMVFKASALLKRIRATDHNLKFSLKITYKYKGKEKKVLRILEFSGKWVLRNNFNVEFIIKYSGVRKHSIGFILEKIFRKNSKIIISLKSSLDRKFCFDIVFEKEFKNDAEFFIALSKCVRETKALAGVRVRF